jgi:hypothetical protein
MMSGPGAALPAIWEGNAKMPLPIIDPTTMAVMATTPRPGLGPTGRDCAGVAIVFCDIVDSQSDGARSQVASRITDVMHASSHTEESLVPDTAA